MSITGQKTSGNKGTNTGYQVASVEIDKLLLQRITAAGGSLLVTSSNPVTNGNFYSFIVQEDTVISTMTGGTPPDKSTNYLVSLGISGKTIKQGALFMIPLGEIITTINIGSGSIIAYKQIK